MRISDWSSDVCSSDLRMAEVTINGADGSYKAYVAMPKQTPAPGVLVAQEIFGVNQVMRDTCDALAQQGFLALCPDLFWRIEPGIDITDKTRSDEHTSELQSIMRISYAVFCLKKK